VGRFWGWDPKETARLIIVLWNALILHARMGGIVKERGLMVLALGGNIVHRLVMVRREPARRRPAQLWLHVRAVQVAHAFIGSQLALIALGLIPCAPGAASAMASHPPVQARRLQAHPNPQAGLNPRSCTSPQFLLTPRIASR